MANRNEKCQDDAAIGLGVEAIKRCDRVAERWGEEPPKHADGEGGEDEECEGEFVVSDLSVGDEEGVMDDEEDKKDILQRGDTRWVQRGPRGPPPLRGYDERDGEVREEGEKERCVDEGGVHVSGGQVDGAEQAEDDGLNFVRRAAGQFEAGREGCVELDAVVHV